MFEVKVSIEVTKDGAKFCESVADYSNMDYDAMQTVQGTIVKALVALGDAGMTPKEDVPATT